VEWWVNVNRDNIHAAEVLVELMLGPWVRPQFRAAYALQMLNDQLRNMGITEASKLSTSEGLHRLLDAVTAKRVVDFTVKEVADMFNEGELHELIQNFSRRIRVRISESLT